MIDWDGIAARADYAAAARGLIGTSTDFDFEALATDPFAYLMAHDCITLDLRDTVQASCGGGYYDVATSTIYLHPSIRRRNNFTLLHELGHHLQENHADWAFILLDLDQSVRVRVEEAVSDYFASLVLMPWEDEALDPYDSHPADVMAGLFRDTEASRSAIVRRVQHLLPDNAKWILAVADLDGRVEFAVSTYGDFPPAKNSIQAGFAALAAEAQCGPSRRNFIEGLSYSDGGELHDMRAEAALDEDGRYVFVGLKPESRYSAGGRYEVGKGSCGNPACGMEFELRYSLGPCEKCGARKCSFCKRCSCQFELVEDTCPGCNLVISSYERDHGTHECW